MDLAWNDVLFTLVNVEENQHLHWKEKGKAEGKNANLCLVFLPSGLSSDLIQILQQLVNQILMWGETKWATTRMNCIEILGTLAKNLDGDRFEQGNKRKMVWVFDKPRRTRNRGGENEVDPALSGQMTISDFCSLGGIAKDSSTQPLDLGTADQDFPWYILENTSHQFCLAAHTCRHTCSFPSVQ